MNLCDTNIWLALALSGHGLHATARDWLNTVETSASVHFCRSTQQSFLRLLTNPAVLGAYGCPPLTNHQAWAAYSSFLDDHRITLMAEPTGLEQRWAEYSRRDLASPKLWMDSYLAAFAQTGGYRMVTNDNAFRQFDGLQLLVLN